MSLEQIAQMYGMNDYYDMHTGRTYHLSLAKEIPDERLSVPVSEDGRLIGYTTMRKVEV